MMAHMNPDDGSAWRERPWGPWSRHEGRFQTGNRAFDAYRAATMKRLEEDYAAFMDYLERLRFAKDKEAFDTFLAERRNAGGPAADEAKPA